MTVNRINRKLNITLSPKVYAQLLASAEDMGLTLSGYISMCIMDKATQTTVADNLPQILEMSKKLPFPDVANGQMEITEFIDIK